MQIDADYGIQKDLQNDATAGGFSVFAIGVLVAALCGCAPKLTGGWETVDVQPAGASFPFNRIEFDPSGKYTSSGLFDGSGRMTNDVRTTTGDYRRSGSQLQVQPHKGDPQTYRLRRRLDGKMEIILDIPGQKVRPKAVLAPSGK
jgi:hypothetical protein